MLILIYSIILASSWKEETRCLVRKIGPVHVCRLLSATLKGLQLLFAYEHKYPVYRHGLKICSVLTPSVVRVSASINFIVLYLVHGWGWAYYTIEFIYRVITPSSHESWFLSEGRGSWLLKAEAQYVKITMRSFKAGEPNVVTCVTKDYNLFTVDWP